jgi:hypothetical protein
MALPRFESRLMVVGRLLMQRGSGRKWSSKTTDNFCEKNEIQMIVRSHEVFSAGYAEPLSPERIHPWYPGGIQMTVAAYAHKTCLARAMSVVTQCIERQPLGAGTKCFTKDAY